MIDDKVISYYNLYFSDGLIYNTFTNVLSVDSRLHNNCNTLSEPEKLVIHNFVLDNINKEINSNSILSLRILVSYDCNAKCSYCYQRLNHYTDDKSIIDFSKLLSFITEYVKNNYISAVQLFWYGGESLCHFDEIYKFIVILHRVLPNDMKLYNDFSTNGYLLNNALLSYFSDIPNISFSISFEPSEFLLNKYRPEKRYVLFDNYLTTIKPFVDLYPSTFVFVLAYYNIDELFRFAEIAKCYKLVNADIFIGRLTNTNHCLGKLSKHVIRVDKFISLHNRLYYNFVKSGFKLNPSRLNPFNNGCNYFVKHSFVILPSGVISKCHVHSLDEKHILSNLSTCRSDYDIVDTYKECFGCKLLPLCKGGCVDRFLKRGKRACYMKTLDGYNYAYFSKSIIDEAFKMMYVLSHQKGNMGM